MDNNLRGWGREIMGERRGRVKETCMKDPWSKTIGGMD